MADDTWRRRRVARDLHGLIIRGLETDLDR
jgi:hypothetical protein